MIVVLSVILLSFILYFLLYYNKPSIFVQPDIAQVTFFRDYLLLTLMSYVYYLYHDNYEKHYILKQISSPSVISQASIHAFIFMFVFLISFRILNVAFSNSIKRIKIKVDEKNIVLCKSF